MRLPLVGDQHFLLEPTKTGVDIGGLLMKVRRHSPAIGGKRDWSFPTSNNRTSEDWAFPYLFGFNYIHYRLCQEMGCLASQRNG